MPNYQQVYVGLEPDTIATLDDMDGDRSEIIRRYVKEGLDREEHHE